MAGYVTLAVLVAAVVLARRRGKYLAAQAWAAAKAEGRAELQAELSSTADARAVGVVYVDGRGRGDDSADRASAVLDYDRAADGSGVREFRQMPDSGSLDSGGLGCLLDGLQRGPGAIGTGSVGVLRPGGGDRTVDSDGVEGGWS